jgi:hypothetical protein
VQYLARWKGHGLEWDTWYNEADLDNAQDLIRDYKEGLVVKEGAEKAARQTREATRRRK